MLLVAAGLGIGLYGWLTPPSRLDTTASSAHRVGKDQDLFAAVVGRLAEGDSYYDTMGAELRARAFPARAILNWRTPFHFSVIGRSGMSAATIAAAGIGVLWLGLAVWRIRRRSPLEIAWTGLALLGAAATISFAAPGAVLFPEAWAGGWIALSLAAYATGRPLLGATAGILAVFCRELAALYAVIAAAVALVEHRRGEVRLWLAGGALYSLAYAAHVAAVLQAIRPDDLAHAQSWVQWQGVPFVFQTVRWYAWTLIAPAVLAPLVVALGLLGTCAATWPLQGRIALVAYLIAYSILGQPFNSYWGLVTAPLWAFAVAHVPDALRALVFPTESSWQIPRPFPAPAAASSRSSSPPVA